MKTTEAETAREYFEYWMFDTGEGIEVLTENHEYFTRKPEARLIVAKGTSQKDLHRFATAFLDHLQRYGFNGEGPECFESFPPSKAEHAAGRAVCDSEIRPPKSHEKTEAARIAAWEEDVVIAGDGNCHWAVISKGRSSWNRKSPDFDNEYPCVIHARLESREAAEIARWDALLGLTDQTHNSPYGPSEVPLSYFNAVGRVLAKLREAGAEADDLVALAVGIAAAAGERPSIPDYTHDLEIPF